MNEATLPAVGLPDDKALQLAKHAYEGSTTYFDTNIRSGVEKDLRQFQGQHSSDSKYLHDAYRTRSKFYRPKTRAAIRKNEAVAAEAFFSTLDLIDVQPENDKNKQHQLAAEVNKALLQYRLSKTLPWFLLCIGAYQDAQTVGVVISYQSWKYDANRGIDRPNIELVPIENFRFDPASDWTDPIGTSPYLIQMLPMYVKDVKRRMQSGEWAMLSDDTLLKATKQWDTIRQTREGQRTDSTDRVTAINDYTIVWVHRNVVEHDGIDYLYYTLDTIQLLSTPVPLKKRFAHGLRPYVLGISILETHKVYPGGIPRISRDTVGEINEIANQRIDNVKFAMNKRYFVKRNRQVDLRSLTRNVPSSVTLLTDPEADVKVIDTPDVTSSSYQEQDRLNLDFDELVGNFSPSSVQSNRRLNETVGGMAILTDNVNQVSGYQLRTFVETWVEPVLNQLLLLEYYYETDERIMQLVGDKVGLIERVGPEAVTEQFMIEGLVVTVNVGMGATNPTQKVNLLMMALNNLRTALEDGVLQNYGIDPSEIIKEVLGAVGYRDGGRFITEGGEDPRVAALMQQVQQLQQALEAKNPPELIAAQVREIEARIDLINKQALGATAKKVKDGVETAYAAMQAAEVIAAVPEVAPVADTIMQIAGYTPPIPGGVDPNFAVPGTVPGMGVASKVAEATGADAVVQDQQAADAGNTDPVSSPNAPTAGTGERKGIETQRQDGTP